ncbi:MAG TPA: Mur ligase family protein [Thermoanaerobaculia bacterium]|jgi:UDP-N-acetylmuramyl tripeptide synthase|nr:Mur ligase family protein [Thermoanaerobaculia bacterium]
MIVLDSRRLTGPNLLWDREGAVLDVALAPEEAEAAIDAWRREARRLLDAVGWSGEATAVRRFPGGASLALSAPDDALYAATEINDEAWAAATASPIASQAEDPVERLRAAIERERNPALLALRAAAEARSVAFLSDDEHASVGLGIGSLTWPVNALPRPDEVSWDQVRDIPVVLVTGTNGKTTTVRLLAAMVRSAGLTAGMTSTDRVEVGGEILDRGDFSGPEGARRVLRDRRVELAILETARGGILRRGLAVRRADVALVTNVAADHLGEQGIGDLDSLADTKMVVTRVVGADGHAVLNADDPLLIARVGGVAATVVWFSLDPERSPVHQRLGAAETAWVLRGGELERWSGGWKQVVGTVDDIPIAFSGAARHNVANALAALAAGSSLLLPDEAMLRGLRHVRGTPEDNPGRGNLIELDNVKILLDYAHNPHGIAAVLGIAANLTARRRLILLGQAGDRDDASLRDLARAAWKLSPDRVVIKELPEMLRGRQPGEVPAILEDEIRKLGAGDEMIGRATTEIEAVREALAWARKGDLLLLLVHTQREDVLALLDRLREGGWEAGQPVGR